MTYVCEQSCRCSTHRGQHLCSSGSSQCRGGSPGTSTGTLLQVGCMVTTPTSRQWARAHPNRWYLQNTARIYTHVQTGDLYRTYIHSKQSLPINVQGFGFKHPLAYKSADANAIYRRLYKFRSTRCRIHDNSSSWDRRPSADS